MESCDISCWFAPRGSTPEHFRKAWRLATDVSRPNLIGMWLIHVPYEKRASYWLFTARRIQPYDHTYDCSHRIEAFAVARELRPEVSDMALVAGETPCFGHALEGLCDERARQILDHCALVCTGGRKPPTEDAATAWKALIEREAAT